MQPNELEAARQAILSPRTKLGDAIREDQLNTTLPVSASFSPMCDAGSEEGPFDGELDKRPSTTLESRNARAVESLSKLHAAINYLQDHMGDHLPIGTVEGDEAENADNNDSRISESDNTQSRVERRIVYLINEIERATQRVQYLHRNIVI